MELQCIFLVSWMFEAAILRNHYHLSYFQLPHHSISKHFPTHLCGHIPKNRKITCIRKLTLYIDLNKLLVLTQSDSKGVSIW